MHTFRVCDTKIYFDKEKDSENHYEVLDEIFNFMKDRGFKIEVNPETLKYYPSIAKDYFYGRKGDLEFKSHRYPTGFEIEFYQNIVTENKSGGEYDFNKFKKMPYIVKVMFKNESSKIVQFLERKQYKNESENEHRSAEDKVKQHFVDSWHHPQENMNFNLKDLDSTTCEANYNNTDRDKKTIYNGEIKYFRGYKNYLMRGKVYHNINNMWWIILNDTEYTNVTSFQLFDLKDTDIRGKKKTIKRYMNPKNIEYSDQEYRIGDNLFIFNCRTGLFKANTDYGNYKYHWSSQDDFEEFLIKLDRYYFLDKMSYGKELEELDYETTIREWKNKIIEIRRDEYDYESFDAEKARELWTFIDERLDSSMSCETIQRCMYDECGDLDIEEPWYEFDIHKKYKKEVEEFYKLFCEFQNILKKEIEIKNEYGEYK